MCITCGREMPGAKQYELHVSFISHEYELRGVRRPMNRIIEANNNKYCCLVRGNWQSAWMGRCMCELSRVFAYVCCPLFTSNALALLISEYWLSLPPYWYVLKILTECTNTRRNRGGDGGGGGNRIRYTQLIRPVFYFRFRFECHLYVVRSKPWLWRG